MMARDEALYENGYAVDGLQCSGRNCPRRGGECERRMRAESAQCELSVWMNRGEVRKYVCSMNECAMHADQSG